MSDKMMWFGTRGYETWVPMFAGGDAMPKTGWSVENAYLNGGAGTRNSVASHKTFPLTWPPNTRDAFRPITDFADGVFGDGLIYFIDPVAADKNVLPQHWAFPAQSGYDAPILFGGNRPQIVDTLANTLRYPTKSLQYDLSGPSNSVYIPIPPGFTAWVGVHGSADGWGGVKVTPYVGKFASDPQYPDILSVTDPTRVNLPFESSQFSGIEVGLGTGTGIRGGLFPALDLYPSLATYPDTAASPATSVILSGLMVQMLPTGAMPASGAFISGQGHSGCEFVGKPAMTPYIIAEGIERVGLSARLIETGSWK